MNPDLFQLENIPEPPKIDPVPEGVARPLFSVMIPVCNRIKYLRQTIESVLHENYPLTEMQICIVDNSTEKIDWQSFLTPQETLRIEIFHQPEHVRLGENWNTCIRQARGHLVHILHDDDWILQGFYDEISRLRTNNPSAALFATRSVATDDSGSWLWLSQQMPNHKECCRCIKDFHFGTPLQCAATVVCREFYEKFGGFLTNLIHTIDWEMWNRATHKVGSIVSSKVAAAYRQTASNSTYTLSQTADNFKDHLLLTNLFKLQNKEFPYDEAINRLYQKAQVQAQEFLKKGNIQAAQYAREFAESLASPPPKGFAWFLYGLSNYLRRQADKFYSRSI